MTPQMLRGMLRTAPPRPLGISEESISKFVKAGWGGEPKPFQWEVMRAVLAGNDVLGVFAVGMGKSLTFQALAGSLPEGVTLVLSPLIALMQDQIQAGVKLGLSVETINSSLSENGVKAVIEKAARGKCRVLYVAPERLFSASFVALLRQIDIRLVAVDEAHCASRLAQLRPAYTKIAEAINAMRRRPIVMALTATMTDAMEAEIAQHVGLRPGYKRLVGDPIRPNLAYRSAWVDSSWSGIVKWLPALAAPGQHIIYVGSRGLTEKVARHISDGSDRRIGKNALDPRLVGCYHAGLDHAKRKQVQEDFKAGRKTVLVATSAFGMGVDVPTIRTVINFGVPNSIEEAVQMGGRAGRDGLPAQWVVLGDDKSQELQQRFFDNGYPPYSVYAEVWSWLRQNAQEPRFLSGKIAIVEMGDKGFKRGSYTAESVTAVLSAFEAANVITSRPVSSGYMVTIPHRTAIAPLQGAAAVIRDEIVSRLGVPPPGESRSGVFTGESERSISELLWRSTLIRMDGSGHLSAVPDFDGAMVSVLPEFQNAHINDLISPQVVEAKRTAELARFHAILRYAKMSTGHAAFLRGYFAKASGPC